MTAETDPGLPDPATYSVEEFAAVMGISRAAAYRLCRPSEGEPRVLVVQLGRTLRIPKAWVAKLLEGRAHLHPTSV